MAAATTSSSRSYARLGVSNFGPIVEADIELRPLTVFVGPSNTGKSLLSILIYVLHRWLGTEDAPSRHGNYSSWVRGSHFTHVSKDEVHGIRDTLKAWLLDVHEEADLVAVPRPVVDLARARLTRPELGSYFVGELVRCFGVDKLSQLIRHGRHRHARFSLRTVFDQKTDESFEFDANILSDKFAWRASIPSGIEVRLDSDQFLGRFRSLFLTREDALVSFMLNDLIFRIAGELAKQCTEEFFGAAHYLPADRTGIMHAHRVVVGSLIHRSSRAGLRAEEPLPVLSGVVADFLERLVEMPHHGVRRRAFNERLADRLEEHVLDGSIKVDTSDTGYPLFRYLPNGWKNDLPLMNASSMVSEVAPVVLYLRNVVRAGDTLIVEEPESHLHPEMQVELTRHLAAAVHAGLRVVLTTHSEWVLEALANLVRLSGLPQQKRTGISGAEYALSADQVGAWMFRPKKRPKGSVVEEIALDGDAGTFPAGYGDITDSLYNEWATITNRIEAGIHQ